MGLPLQTIEYNDLGGGLDLISSPTKGEENISTESLNISYTIDGAIATRDGSTILNKGHQIAGTPKSLASYDYIKSDGSANVQVLCAGTAIYHDLSNPVAAVTGLSALLPYPDLEFFVTNNDEFLIWGNGIDANKKFNGTDWTALSLPTPTAMTLNGVAAGAIPDGTYDYYVSFGVRDSLTGIIMQEGPLSPVFRYTKATGINNTITLNVPVSADTQVNCRILYRKKIATGVVYRITDGATITDNVTLTYADNTTDANLSSIEADFDNQAAPVSSIFEEFENVMYYRDDNRPTDFLSSVPFYPWNAPETTRTILDAEITAMKRCFNVLVIGTRRSIWTLDAAGDLRRVTSEMGIINNRALDGFKELYFVGSNRSFYRIYPTELVQDRFTFSEPLSRLVGPIFKNISGSALNDICVKQFTKSNINKVFISVPSATTNDSLIVLNLMQSQSRDTPVWENWDNINASFLQTFTLSNETQLVSGDYNGFVWKLHDDSVNGDGAEDNGTSSGSNTNLTLNDTTKTWVVNDFNGVNVRITEGKGAGQVRTIVSNTATELTISAVWTEIPDDTSVYTIGGYVVSYFSNWKKVISSYEVLKQLWYLWINANTTGLSINFPIKMILQFDFDTTTANQLETYITLAPGSAIWGAFTWGAELWGSRSVFLDRFRKYAKFRCMRIGFYHDLAGQPFQINNYAISAQSKELYFKNTL